MTLRVNTPVVVALQGFAGQDGGPDLEDVVARMVGDEVEGHGLLLGPLAQEHRLDVDQPPVAQQGDIDHARVQPLVREGGHQLHRRADKGEIVGEHTGYGEVAQSLLGHEHGVHGCRQGLEGAPGFSIERSPSDTSRVYAIGDHDDRAQVAAGKARPQLGQRLANPCALGLGRGQGIARGGSEGFAESVKFEPVPIGLPVGKTRSGRGEEGSGALRASRPSVGGRHRHRTRAVQQDGDVVGHDAHLAELELGLETDKEADADGGGAQEHEPEHATPTSLAP